MKWDKLPDGRSYLPAETILLLEGAGGWYRITGAPIGFGGSGIIYPAVRIRRGESGWEDDEMNLAVKECYPSVPGRVLKRDDIGRILGADQKNYQFALEQMRKEKSVTGTIYNAGFRLVPVWTSSEREQLALDGKDFKRVDNYYAVMERIDEKGRSLENLIRSEKLTAKEIMSLGCQLLRALKEVHESGFIHGDIQTNNIFVKGFETGEDLGMVSLLDFGAARKLESDNKTAPITDRALYTTKGFTAPECITKNDGTLRLSPAADLYSAGCVFLRLLSGRHISRQALELVINGKYIYSRQAARLRCPDSACEAINRFLDRALKRDPADRYQSAEEMLRDAVKIEQSLAPTNIAIASSEYAAFISYCHSDKTEIAAKLLADSIENYTIPGYAELIHRRDGSNKGIGRKKRKLGKVFLDRTELSGGGDMGEQIVHALENSAFLIVVLGGGSERSEWVAREIEAFLKTHTRDRILTVLVDGHEKEAMPEILRKQEFFTENGKEYQAIESRSADIRSNSIRELKRLLKTEKLRLIAPMLGCGFDDLNRREKEAHTRFVIRSLSVGIAVFTVISLIIGYQYYQIRRKNNQLLRFHVKELAEKSGQYLAEGDREQALSLALEAIRDAVEIGDEPVCAEARAALQNALYLYRDSNTLTMAKKATRIMKMGQKAAAGREAISPDGLKMLTMGSGGSVFVWDLETGKCIAGPDEENENELSRDVLFAGFLDDHQLLVLKKDIALRYPITLSDEVDNQEVNNDVPEIIAAEEELFYWYKYKSEYDPMMGTFNEDRSLIAFCNITQWEQKETVYGIRTVAPELVVCEVNTMQVVGSLSCRDYSATDSFLDVNSTTASGPVFSPDSRWAALPLTDLYNTQDKEIGAILLIDLVGSGSRVITNPESGFLSCRFAEDGSLFIYGYTPVDDYNWVAQEVALEGAAFCIDTFSGEVKWRTPIENQTQMGEDALGMILHDNLVILWGNRQIQVLDKSDGNRLRTIQIGNRIAGVCDSVTGNGIVVGDRRGNIIIAYIDSGIISEIGTSIDCEVDHFWWDDQNKRMVVSHANDGSYVLLEESQNEASETVLADGEITGYVLNRASPYMLVELHSGTYTVLDLRNGQCRGSYPIREDYSTNSITYRYAGPEQIYKLGKENGRKTLQVIDIVTDEVLLEKELDQDTFVYFDGFHCGWQEDTRFHLMGPEGENVIELPEETKETVSTWSGQVKEEIPRITKMQISDSRFVYLYGSVGYEDRKLSCLYDLKNCNWLPVPSGVIDDYNKGTHIVHDNGVSAYVDYKASSIKIFDAGKSEANTTIPVSSIKDCLVDFNPDGLELYCIMKNDVFRIFDSRTGKQKSQSREIYTYPYDIYVDQESGTIFLDAISADDDSVSGIYSDSTMHVLWLYEETPEGTLCRMAGADNGIHDCAANRIICVDKAKGSIFLYDFGEEQLEELITRAEKLLAEYSE